MIFKYQKQIVWVKIKPRTKNKCSASPVQSSLSLLRILRYHDRIDLGFAFHIWLDYVGNMYFLDDW